MSDCEHTDRFRTSAGGYEFLDTEPCRIEDRRPGDVLRERPSQVCRVTCPDCNETFLFVVSARDTSNLSSCCEPCLAARRIEKTLQDSMRRFAERYATRSSVSLRFLHEANLVVAVCDCDAENCAGFQMVGLESLQRDDAVLGRETVYHRLTDLGLVKETDA